MDDLKEQIELLESSDNLSASINHVQKAIDLLTAARTKIAAGLYPHHHCKAACSLPLQTPRRHP